MKKTEDYTRLNYDLVAKVFQKNNLQINRNTKRQCLLEVLNKTFEHEIKQLQEKEKKATLSIIDIRRLTRIKHASCLSETQLELELKTLIINKDLIVNETILSFLQCFWNEVKKEIDKNPNAQKIYDDLVDIEKFDDLTSTVLVLIDSDNMKEITIDDENYFDGLGYDDLRQNLYVTSDIKELNLIAKKYGVTVPKSYKKEDLQKRLLKGLKVKGILDAETEIVIENSSLKELKSMLIKNSLPDFVYLLKKDVIEYILKNAKTISHLYVEPNEKVYDSIPKNIEKPIETKVEKDNNVFNEKIVENQENYQHYLKTIIDNQEQMIKLLTVQNQDQLSNKKQKIVDRIYSYIIFILIIFVALIWLVYVFNNFIL